MEPYDQERPSGNEIHKSLLRNNLGKNFSFEKNFDFATLWASFEKWLAMAPEWLSEKKSNF